MYRTEVPLYGILVQIVHQVDSSILTARGENIESLPTRHQLERHGAIRLGTPHELQLIKRLFAVFGMHPVGYYNLGIVGYPLHATAFRPVAEDSLKKNPFRVFTTLLRKDLMSPNIRAMAENILRKRNLFTPRLLEIIDQVEVKGFMTAQDADDLIYDALKIFQWHSQSAVAVDEYLELNREHPMIADIVCFPSAHINHLTPKTLDIELVQKEMIKQGLPAKERIEGPPNRQCPILLRQTSFKALEEQVEFHGPNGFSAHGSHTARFGEVEQRGAAVTRKGRQLYDELLNLASKKAASLAPEARNFDDFLSDTFSSYPDTWAELQAQNLVYFMYQITSDGQESASRQLSGRQTRASLEQLIYLGVVKYEPITYEDFLPFSAAGIFQSNLGDGPARPLLQESQSSLRELEDGLGCKVLDEFDLYSAVQQESIKACEKALKLEIVI